VWPLANPVHVTGAAVIKPAFNSWQWRAGNAIVSLLVRPADSVSQTECLATLGEMSDRRSPRQNSPASPEKQRDSVSSRSLPPVSSLDLRSDGRKIGPCPSCAGHRWWDNRGAKRAGQSRADTADFRCVACGHQSMDADAPASFGNVTSVAPEIPDGKPAGGPSGFRRCTATNKNGQQCANGAMAGMDVCGPHAAGGGGSTARTCAGTTKSGKPCRAGAMRGKNYCPQHQPGS
jgi:hypothetical protein